MKRICTLSLAASLLVLSACKGGAGADAAKLVPDDADMLAGANMKTVTESELYKAFGAEAEKDEDYKKAVASMKECGLELASIEAIVVGVKASSEDFVAIIAADGVGKDDTATCLIKSVQKANGDEEAADVTKEDGHKIIQFTDGRAYLVSDNMLAVTTKGWETAVGELIDGKGKPAIENSKKDLFGKVDTKAAMWFLADVPSDVAGMAAFVAPEVSKIKTAAGSVDLSKGLAINLIAGFGSEDEAKAVAEMGTKMLDEAKADPTFGSAAGSVKIEASGSDVKVAASMSTDEITTLQKAAN